jgi:hypothetical protein
MPNYRLGISVSSATLQAVASFRNLKNQVNGAGVQAQVTRAKFAGLGQQTGNTGQQAQGAKNKLGALGNQTNQFGQQAQKAKTQIGGLGNQVQKTGQQFQDANGRWRDANGRFLNMGRSAGIAGKGIFNLGSSAQFSMGKLRGLTQGIFNFKNLLLSALAVVAGGKLFDATIGNNADIQSQRIALSSILNANLKYKDGIGRVLDAQKSWQKSMGISSDMLAKFREDALLSPGTSQELMTLFQGSLNPGLAAGKNLEQLRKFSNLALTTSKIMRTDIDQTSSDVQLMLSGNAGQDVVTWRNLKDQIGLSVEQFNKLPQAERFRLLEKAMRSFASPQAIREFAKGWKGITSSLDDFKTIFFEILGKKGFATIKEYLGRAVTWLSENKKAWKGLASEIGSRFATGIKTAVSFGQDLFKMFNQARPVIQTVIARAREVGSTIIAGAQSAMPFVRLVIQGFLEMAATVYNAVMPVVQQFWAILKPLIGVVMEWLAQNKVLLLEAWNGFKMLVGVVANLTTQVAGFIALGLFVVIMQIVKAVIEVAAKFRMWITEIANIPTRMEQSWKDVQAGFLRLGMWLTEKARQIPILGMLFGLVDMKFGIADKLQGELNRIKGQSAQLNQLVNDRVNQYNMSDPKAQYQASLRLYAATQRGYGGGVFQTTVNNYVTTPDPVRAGNTAAKNTATAITKTVKSIPTTKLGQPITAPGVRR